MNPPPSQLISAVRYNGPEALFRIGPVQTDGVDLTASMPMGSWLCGPDGRLSPGALGILADDVLGYSIVAARPRGRWSVSSEITMDFLAPALSPSGPIQASAHLVEATPDGGFASGELRDSDGRIIATCSQRGRFVDLGPITAVDTEPVTQTPGHSATDLATLIGARITPGTEGTRLEFATTHGLDNQMGNMHGGISLCASELLGTSVLQGPGAPLVAASIHVVYLRPIPVGSAITFTATVLHRGRSTGLVTVVSTNAAGKPCTIATIMGHVPA